MTLKDIGKQTRIAASFCKSEKGRDKEGVRRWGGGGAEGVPFLLLLKLPTTVHDVIIIIIIITTLFPVFP